MHADGILVEHHIGAFKADRPAEFAEHLLQPRFGFGRRTIDQPRRILRDDMLERRPPRQRAARARAAEDRGATSSTRSNHRDQVQQQPGALRRRLDHRLAPGEHRPGFVERLTGRHRDEGFQRCIDRRQQVVQQAGVREQRLRCLRVRPGGGHLRREAVDPLLQRLDRLRRGVAPRFRSAAAIAPAAAAELCVRRRRMPDPC